MKKKSEESIVEVATERRLIGISFNSGGDEGSYVGLLYERYINVKGKDGKTHYFPTIEMSKFVLYEDSPEISGNIIRASKELFDVLAAIIEKKENE